jgi:putative membrane protein
MKRLALFAVAVVGLTAAGLVADQPRKGGDEVFSDKMFVEKAAVGGMFEVKSSQLAQQMATDANVKNFAAHMVADHTKANQELMGLARQKGWQVPATLDQKHQEMLDQLGKNQSGQFDKAYMDIQVKAHDKTVMLFDKASKECQDADLKAWAVKTLPTLKQHQQMAKQTAGHGSRQ